MTDIMEATSAGAERVGRAGRRGVARAFARQQCAFTLFELLLVVAIVGILSALAMPTYQRYVDDARVQLAKVDIRTIESVLERYYSKNNAYPDTLAQAGIGNLRDPWGNPYRYLRITPATNRGSMRKDRNLVPINSDYDLYSMGKDGDSRPPLTASASRDDVVRANNGRFVGLGADY